ncbi:MAG: hypothetical protein K9J17_07115 [Flavobacteriales bacterium]|nr:hypothetical protein [Flavobacteriales bacterium]
MKRLPTFLLATFLIGSLCSSCNTDKDDDDKLPDAIFNATVTGAISQNISFTLAENMVNGTQAVNGSYTGASDMFAMSAQDIGTWQFGISYSATSFGVGTYDVLGTSGFSNPSLAQAGFLATSGTISISKAELYQGVGSGLGGADDYFIDGSFTILMESTDTPPQQIQVSGSFTGINIKVN